MKKILFCVIIILPFNLFSQTFEGGVQLALTGSQIDGDGYGGYKQVFVSPMIFTSLNLKNSKKITSGVVYTLKGAREMHPAILFNTKLHYLEIPILLTFKLKTLDTILRFSQNFDFTTGLSLGYLVKGEIFLQGAYTDILQTNRRKFDYTLWLSANYNISANYKLQFIYNYSIIPLDKVQFDFSFYTTLINRTIYSNYTPWVWWNRTIRLSLQIKLFNIR